MQALQERMNALEPNENKINKFLGCEQAERIDMKKAMKTFQIQMEKRTRKLVGGGLYDKTMVKAINCRVILADMMNVCTFTGKELDQLDKGIKKISRESNMHGEQCSDERLYLRRELGGRRIKSLNDVYTI